MQLNTEILVVFDTDGSRELQAIWPTFVSSRQFAALLTLEKLQINPLQSALYGAYV